MDIYKFAMQMEKDGESYYRNSAQKTRNTGLKNILNLLADAEAQHFGILQKMKHNEKAQTTNANILTDVKNIFVKMKEEMDTLNVEVAEIEIYKRAQEIEVKSQNFYLEKAENVKDELQREIFLKIAEEEKKHYFILENIIDFVSRPYNWLENNEWYHLEEY
jgi:rubrerythrin